MLGLEDPLQDGSAQPLANGGWRIEGEGREVKREEKVGLGIWDRACQHCQPGRDLGSASQDGEAGGIVLTRHPPTICDGSPRQLNPCKQKLVSDRIENTCRPPRPHQRILTSPLPALFVHIPRQGNTRSHTYILASLPALAPCADL